MWPGLSSLASTNVAISEIVNCDRDPGAMVSEVPFSEDRAANQSTSDLRGPRTARWRMV